MQVAAVIVAAGKGVRFGHDKPKQFLDLAGQPVLAHTIAAFENHAQIGPIVIVGATDWLMYIAEDIVDKYGFSKVKHIVSGGAERKDSVLAGIEALDRPAGPVLIHDGARPLVPPAVIDRIIAALSNCEAVVPAVAVADTIKEVENGRVIQTPERARLRAIQTPQGFQIEVLQPLLRQAKSNTNLTDEAMLLEKNEIPVTVVEGDDQNLKITTKLDLAIAELILRERKE